MEEKTQAENIANRIRRIRRRIDHKRKLYQAFNPCLSREGKIVLEELNWVMDIINYA